MRHGTDPGVGVVGRRLARVRARAQARVRARVRVRALVRALAAVATLWICVANSSTSFALSLFAWTRVGWARAR